MGFFSSKQKVDMESFCKDYYDSQMFRAIVNDEDASQKILDNAFQLLTDSNTSFSKVNRAVFDSEMTAMHLELFALALFQRFSHFDKAVQHSIFTLRYLEDKNKTDIWEAMGEYNLTIARTAILNANGQEMTGDTRIGRMKITQLNMLRVDFFETCRKAHL